MKDYTILAINPGSTSTKVAVFKGEQQLYSESVKHSADSLAGITDFDEQVRFRKDLILEKLAEADIPLSAIDAYAGRGGGIVNCASGTYEVNRLMLDYVHNNPLIHPSKFGSHIAYDFAQMYGKKAYIVNSPHTDEYEDVSRILGIEGIYKECHLHALNQKEVAIRAAKALGRTYGELNFVVAHLGGGISVTAHKRGRMVDSTDCITGDGPMSPTRSGQIDAIPIVDLCFSGRYTKEDLYLLIMADSGLLSHLGTSDGLEIETMVKEGQPYVKLVFDAMLHQIAKSVGAMAAVLDGEVDGVVYTGGLVRDEYAIKTLVRKTGFIAPVMLYPGEFEMEALSNGVLRVLTGEEAAKEYTGVPAFTGFDPAQYPKPVLPRD